MKASIPFFAIVILLSSCVPQKKYAELEAENQRLKALAPALEARKDAGSEEMTAKLEQIRQLEMQVKTLEENEKQLAMMMAAGEMEPPTPEQMRAYEMQHAKELQETMEAGADPLVGERSELALQFEQGAFENRLVTKTLQATLKGYPKEQIDYDLAGGRSVVCIDSKEFFESGSSDLSDLGKSLVSQIGVAVQGQSPLFYRIVGVSEKNDPAALAKASDRAGAIYSQLANEKGAVRLPISFGASSCKNAAGKTSVSCDRIEIIFEQEYERIMGQVEATLIR